MALQESRPNGRAISALAATLTIALALVGGGVWVGAQEKDLVSHKEKPCHDKTCDRLNMVEKELSGLKATVEATAKATDKKIEDLKANQRDRFDRIESLLRRQN